MREQNESRQVGPAAPGEPAQRPAALALAFGEPSDPRRCIGVKVITFKAGVYHAGGWNCNARERGGIAASVEGPFKSPRDHQPGRNTKEPPYPARYELGINPRCPLAFATKYQFASEASRMTRSSPAETDSSPTCCTESVVSPTLPEVWWKETNLSLERVPRPRDAARFGPVVLVVPRRRAVERERACDRVVVRRRAALLVLGVLPIEHHRLHRSISTSPTKGNWGGLTVAAPTASSKAVGWCLTCRSSASRRRGWDGGYEGSSERRARAMSSPIRTSRKTTPSAIAIEIRITMPTERWSVELRG